MQEVVKALVAAAYDGTAESAADVLAAVQRITTYSGNEWAIKSDDGTVLILEESNPWQSAEWPVLAGQTVVVDPGFGILDRISAEQFEARYRAS